MAPPTPIYSRVDIFSHYQSQLNDPNCNLRWLTQNECTFNGSGEIICLPFKRLFKNCKLSNGKFKLIEITDQATNNPLATYKNEAEKFLNAEKDLRKLYEYELST